MRLLCYRHQSPYYPQYRSKKKICSKDYEIISPISYLKFCSFLVWANIILLEKEEKRLCWHLHIWHSYITHLCCLRDEQMLNSYVNEWHIGHSCRTWITCVHGCSLVWILNIITCYCPLTVVLAYFNWMYWFNGGEPKVLIFTRS